MRWCDRRSGYIYAGAFSLAAKRSNPRLRHNHSYMTGEGTDHAGACSKLEPATPEAYINVSGWSSISPALTGSLESSGAASHQDTMGWDTMTRYPDSKKLEAKLKEKFPGVPLTDFKIQASGARVSVPEIIELT